MVVVLHGSFGSSGNFEKLANFLQSRGIAVVGFDYAVRGTQNLTPAINQIAAELAALPTSRKLIIVGHSLGAMVGMFVAHNPRLRGRIAAVIGLGGAFRGLPAAAASPIARLGARLLGVRSFAQLLAFNGTTVPDGVRVISLASDADRVVPWTSSAFGEVRPLRGVPHAWLTDVVPEIVDALEDVAGDWKI